MKTFRIFKRNKTSYPFVSGDAFCEISDFVFNDINSFSSRKKNIRFENIQTIFCKSELLEEFLASKPDSLKPKVLIIGNSDRNFTEMPYLPSTVRLALVQNSFISDGNRKQNRIITLPIGLENLSYKTNGLPKYFENPNLKEKVPELLVGPFGKTNPLRSKFSTNLTDRIGEMNVQVERLSPKSYFNLISNYQWVLCPAGNGVDTHRVWESLYLGSQPVLESNNWSESLKFLNLPILILETSEFYGCSEIKTFSRTYFDPNKIASLWMPYWERIISTRLNGIKNF